MTNDCIRKTPGDTAWFTRDRFGMFIHWGLYALGARHEWLKNHERMTDEQYQKYFDRFEPDLYDPREWARMAKAAGMKYAVMTAKHHEGFCLFDSQYTDYKSTNTPAGRDLLREYVEAFRAEGLKVGFYYSLLDWHHPHFPIDGMHPLRELPEAEIRRMNAKRDMKIYARYMRDQVTELLTNYGRIDILWYDFSYPWQCPEDKPWLRGKGAADWEAEELIALSRRLMPGVIINNRTGIDQDIWTPEQYQPSEWPRHPVTGERVPWEACQTFSGSWGYHRDESSWKSPEMLVQMLIKTVSLGGNLIMNVGPTARGYIDRRAGNALQALAGWMKYNSRSIYGCTQADAAYACPEGCVLTQSADGKRLYVHLFTYPFEWLEMRGMRGKVSYAQLLQDASELKMMEGEKDCLDEGSRAGADSLCIRLPVRKPDCLVPVIELFLK